MFSQASPAPGAYDVALAADFLRAQGTQRAIPGVSVPANRWSGIGKGQAPASSPTHGGGRPGTNGGGGGHSNSRAAAAERAEAVRRATGSAARPSFTFRSSSARGTFISAGRAKGVPGPGEYDPALGLGRGDAASLAAPSSFFGNEGTDRFGVQYRPKTVHVLGPGPGEYDVLGERRPATASQGNRAPDASPGPSSRDSGVNGQGGLPAFRLATGRFDEPRSVTLDKAPGPAFYQPSLSATKASRSFILNASGKWI